MVYELVAVIKGVTILLRGQTNVPKPVNQLHKELVSRNSLWAKGMCWKKNSGMKEERPACWAGFVSIRLEGSPNLSGPHFPPVKVNKIGNLDYSY